MNAWPSRFLSACLCVLLLIVASLFFANRVEAQAPDVQPAHVKVAFLVDSLQVERWQRDAEAFRKRAGELGAEVVVESADGNDELQLQQANALIDSGIQALVLVA